MEVEGCVESGVREREPDNRPCHRGERESVQSRRHSNRQVDREKPPGRGEEREASACMRKRGGHFSK